MKAAKAVAALVVSVVGEVITLGILPDKYRVVAGVLVAIATAVVVYQVPNKPAA